MRALARLVAFVGYGALAVPILVVVASSFTTSNYIQFPPIGFTLHWYAEIPKDDALMSGIALSVRVAAVTAVCAALLGTSGALYLGKTQGRMRDLAQSFFLTPLTIPNVVIGLSLLVVFSRFGLVSFLGLVIGHTIVTVPYVVRTVLSSLLNSDRQLPKAASILGARPWQVFLYVTLPIVRPGILASAVFAFLVSFNNITISIFVAAPGTATLPVVLFNKVAYVPEPTVVAVSTLMVAMTTAILLALDRSLSLFRSMFR